MRGGRHGVFLTGEGEDGRRGNEFQQRRDVGGSC
jgi:hypothetical protein